MGPQVRATRFPSPVLSTLANLLNPNKDPCAGPTTIPFADEETGAQSCAFAQDPTARYVGASTWTGPAAFSAPVCVKPDSPQGWRVKADGQGSIRGVGRAAEDASKAAWEAQPESRLSLGLPALIYLSGLQADAHLSHKSLIAVLARPLAGCRARLRELQTCHPEATLPQPSLVCLLGERSEMHTHRMHRRHRVVAEAWHHQDTVGLKDLWPCTRYPAQSPLPQPLPAV